MVPYLCKKCLTVAPKATIRVKFSDRTQLERTFPSADRIRSVYAFVRILLREDVKPIKFVLCVWDCLLFSLQILKRISPA